MVASQKLLVNESPLFVLPGLAKKLQPKLKTRAASASVFLQQIHYYLSLGMGRDLNGKRYIFYTQAQWRDKMPWLSEWDFREIVKELVNLGLLWVEAFNDHKRDRTSHYTINYDHEWLISLSPTLSNASVASKSGGFENVLNHTDTTSNRSSNTSLPLPPQEPPALEKEREPEPNLENPDLVDWDAIKTQTNAEHQQSLEEYNSALPLTANQETFIPTEDPWLDQPSEPSLNNDLTIQPDIYEVVVVEERGWEVVQVPELEPEVVPHPEFCGDSEAAVVQVPELEPEVVDQVPQVEVEVPKLESNPGVGFAAPVLKQATSKPRPIKVEERSQKYVWEVEVGKPIPEFQNWWAKTYYAPQGGHWEVGAYVHAYSEFYNKPDKTTNAIFPQFLAAHKTVAENCQQHQAANQQAILPSYFTLPPAPTEENMHQLASNFQQLVSDGARVALPQGIATSSCQQSISWAEASQTAIAPLPQLHQAAPVGLPQVQDQDLVEQVKAKRIQWAITPLRDSIKKWVEATDGVELGDDGPVLVN